MMVDTGLVAMPAQMRRRIVCGMIGVISAVQPPLMVMIATIKHLVFSMMGDRRRGSMNRWRGLR